MPDPDVSELVRDSIGDTELPTLDASRIAALAGRRKHRHRVLTWSAAAGLVAVAGVVGTSGKAALG